MNVGEIGINVGVVKLMSDGGPLLASDGVDARTRCWSGLTGVGADGSRGREDARVGGMKRCFGDCNSA